MKHSPVIPNSNWLWHFVWWFTLNGDIPKKLCYKNNSQKTALWFYAEFQEVKEAGEIFTQVVGCRCFGPAKRQAKSAAVWVFGNASVRQTPKKRYAYGRIYVVDVRWWYWWDDLWGCFHLAICIHSLFSLLRSTCVLWLKKRLQVQSNSVQTPNYYWLFHSQLVVQYVLGWQLTIVDPKFSSSYLPAISCLLQMFIPQESLKNFSSSWKVSQHFKVLFQLRISGEDQTMQKYSWNFGVIIITCLKDWSSWVW